MSPLFFIFSLTCAATKVYYAYGQSSPQPKVKITEKNPTYNLAVLPQHINNPQEMTKLSVRLSFFGDLQFYPRSLDFEIYADGKRLQLQTPEITVTTVLNNRVTYFKLHEPLNDIPATIARLKAEKQLPQQLQYFRLSGHIMAEIAEMKCPPEIHVELRVKHDGGVFSKVEKFSLRSIEYGKASNRPFG